MESARVTAPTRGAAETVDTLTGFADAINDHADTIEDHDDRIATMENANPANPVKGYGPKDFEFSIGNGEFESWQVLAIKKGGS